jgi:hypothetical protein
MKIEVIDATFFFNKGTHSLLIEEKEYVAYA